MNTLYILKENQINYTHQSNGVTGRNGYDVCTRDHTGAHGFNFGLDPVDDIKTPERVVIGAGGLFSRERGGVIKKYRSIATLTIYTY